MKFFAILLLILLSSILFAVPPSGFSALDDYLFATFSSEEGGSLSVIDLSRAGSFTTITNFSLNALPIGSPIVNGDAMYVVSSNGISVFDIIYPESTEVVSVIKSYPLAAITNFNFKSNELALYGKNGWVKYGTIDPYAPILLDDKLSSYETRVISENLITGMQKYFGRSNSTNITFFCDGARAWVSDEDKAHTNGHSKCFYSSEKYATGPMGFCQDERGFVVLACKSDGIVVFNIGTNGFDTIEKVTSLKTLGDARNVKIINNQLIVADGVNGYGIYEMDECGLLSYIKHITLLNGVAEDFEFFNIIEVEE